MKTTLPSLRSGTIKMEEKSRNKINEKKLGFWKWAIASVFLRLILIYFPPNLNLSSRPEVSTPVTSLSRLAEGYWLKQLSMSPYSGSMYHGSPLLLSVLGPLTAIKIEGQPNHLLCSLVSVVADFICAFLIRATGRILQTAHGQNLKSLGLGTMLDDIEILPSGDIAALVYLWNPFTIFICVSFNTSPIENLFVLLSLYGASAGIVPLAAFGWVMASHLSLYPVVLVVPVILLLGYCPDTLPRKLFLQRDLEKTGDELSTKSHFQHRPLTNKPAEAIFSWWRVILFILWTSIWIAYVLTLCAISIKEYGGLPEMFKRTYGFILTVKDLSPNIGVLWYFFAEVFDFFRNFFLIVFHVNILFMILPLAIRLNHRPCFLAFVYLAIFSMLKSYPSLEIGGFLLLLTFSGIVNFLVGDSALYLGLMALFVNELAEMQFSFFLFCGYVGVSLLSPLMHNLWIWRGTGNANFYFATTMAYASFQIILVVESISAMLNHDRKIRKLCTITEG